MALAVADVAERRGDLDRMPLPAAVGSLLRDGDRGWCVPSTLIRVGPMINVLASRSMLVHRNWSPVDVSHHVADQCAVVYELVEHL